MPKIKKVHRKKKYKVNINRKRLRNKLKRLPNIKEDKIKEAWRQTMSTRTNLKEMGLAYTANDAVKIPNAKKEILENAKRLAKDEETSSENDEGEEEAHVPSRIDVVENLEAEAKAPRERRFRLSNNQVQFATYMLDKYGDDYKAMARDKKNYYQLTPKQIRAKIQVFMNVPEQYNEYLVQKGETTEDSER